MHTIVTKHIDDDNDDDDDDDDDYESIPRVPPRGNTLQFGTHALRQSYGQSVAFIGNIKFSLHIDFASDG